MKFGLSATAARRSIAKVGLASAPLGVLLDNQHGLFHVLSYDKAGLPFEASLFGSVILRTAAWVPFLFLFAGVAMSSIQLVADKLLPSSPASPATQADDVVVPRPSWPKVLYNISLFSAQYYLSGAMDFLGVDVFNINLVLWAVALGGFRLFDASRAGLLLALATAVAGPAAEVFLVNVPQLYTYSHADLFGVCSWIPAVYFLGASAVGNLARAWYHQALDAEASISSPSASEGDEIESRTTPLEVEKQPAVSGNSSPLDDFRRLMGGLYAAAGAAHFYDVLIGDSVLLQQAGLGPFSSLAPAAQAAALLWCASGPAALALSRRGGAWADVGIAQYGVIEVGCAAAAGGSALDGALGVQAAVAASWLWTRSRSPPRLLSPPRVSMSSPPSPPAALSQASETIPRKWRGVVMRDPALFLGEVSALVSGELAYKLFCQVTAPGWTLASEALGPTGPRISQDRLDALSIDAILLVGGWTIANLATYDASLGNRPSAPGRVLDESVGLVVSAANAVLLAVFCACTLQRVARGSVSIDVYGYEVMTAVSLLSALVFRTYYCNRRPTSTL